MIGSLVRAVVNDIYVKGKSIYAGLNRKRRRAIFFSKGNERYFVIDKTFPNNEAIYEIGRRCNIPIKLCQHKAITVENVQVDYVYNHLDFEKIVSELSNIIKKSHKTTFTWELIGTVKYTNLLIVRFNS